jgi:polyisoprenoid-binding protein YceI
LTIKGITKGISFPATLKKVGSKYIANASFSIDRTKWDIRYGSSSFFDNLGNKAIKNEIEFVVLIESL